mgnify:FL=1
MAELVGELGVSVIVATRNRAARLEQMLGSLKVALDEARGPVDVWLVDNGSTDDTRRVIESWCASVLQAQSLYVPEPGKSRALNAAIARARGEVILFTDDDVTLDPGWVNAMREFFLLNPEVAAVAGRILPLVTAGSEKLWAFGAGVWRLVLPIFDLGERPRPCVDMYGANMAVRAQVLRAVGGFDVALGPGTAGFYDDLDLARRIRLAGYEIRYSPAAVVYHDVPLDRLNNRYFWERGVGLGMGAYRADMGRSLLGDCCALAEASASWVGAALLGRREKKMRSLFRIARHWGALRARTNAWWRKQPA